MSAHEYSEIQFLLANNFWGVDFQFGNNPNGIQIRQGIAHLVDKSSFVKNDPNVAPGGVAVDNPVPLNNGGLLAPNPCLWDTTFGESGVNCVVGAPGGTAYHLATATGVNFVWQPALGSLDFCAAAQHFINAGLATGKDSTTCVLTGISSTVTTHTVNIFVRNDSPPRFDLGRSLAQEICALFGQGFVNSCSPYLTATYGPLTIFPVFFVCSATCCTSICLNWHMYTAAFSGVFPFDQSLYFTYNSRFVSGFSSVQPPNGPCSSQSVPTYSPANYMFLCNPAYDALSSQMGVAPCFNAAGDPTPGSVNNGPGATCAGTSQLSAISAGIQTEDAYGKNVFSIPIYAITGAQFAYLSNWHGVINGEGSGIPNFFTWLDAYSPNPTVAGTIRQAFSENTRSLNPYLAESAHDFYMVRNIYDSLALENPLSSGQFIQWMTISEAQLSNSSLTYVPPSGTSATFRFALRSDVFFHDGRRVSSFDVAFSYLSMMASGVFQSSTLSSVTGITLIGPTQFDISVNSVGPFALSHITAPTILPGRSWSSAGSGGWDASMASCMAMGAHCFLAQYRLGPSSSSGTPSIVCTPVYSCAFPASNLNVDPAKLSFTYDPLASGILIGSGQWQCMSSSGVLGIGCSSSGTQNPGGGSPSYTLTRFGRGFAPGSMVSGGYFRSNGNLALHAWSGDNGDFTHDFINLEVVLRCYGLPAQPLGSVSGCGHWQQGIGANGGPTIIGISQISIVARFVAVSWVAPFDWQISPPIGIAPFPYVLHEGGYILYPAVAVGCLQPYPAGGYDC